MVALTALFALLLAVQTNVVAAQGEATGELALGPIWQETDGSGDARINLYFFYSTGCPHCAAAKPFLQRLESLRPWLAVKRLPVEQPDNQRKFSMLALMLGQDAEAVPTFFICGQAIVGFDDEDGVGAQITRLADACHEKLAAVAGSASSGQAAATQRPEQEAESGFSTARQRVQVPFIGDIDPQNLSLPVLTVLLGGLDAFNPCAFFVLLFLLSMLVHARSRWRMAIIGGTFVMISGVMYFLFMTAWLNVFLIVGNIAWVTLVAGLVALAVGLVGVKDYFYFKQGVSLSMSEHHRQKLFVRMRELLSVDSLPVMLLATTSLAIAANFYELICTSGLPMVYTRALTLHELSAGARYGYLALYNVVYVLPLTVIVATFVATLGARKMSEREGRALKLLSGLIMLAMGIVLIAAPELLNNALAAVGMLAGASVAAGLVILLDRLFRRWRQSHMTETSE